MIKVIPFKADHLLQFQPRSVGYFENYESALAKEKGGPAFTAIADDNTILGCAGIIIVWPGVALAWTVFSKDIVPHMTFVTFKIRRILRDIKRALGLHRIEIGVVEGGSERWVELLGFKKEENGRARSYTHDRQNIMRYEITDD